MRNLKTCLCIILTVLFTFGLYAKNNIPIKSMKKVFSIQTDIKKYDPASIYHPKYFFIQESEDSIAFGVIKKDIQRENHFILQFFNNEHVSNSKDINRFYGFPRNYVNSTFIESFSEDSLQWVLTPNNLSQFTILETSEMNIFLNNLKNESVIYDKGEVLLDNFYFNQSCIYYISYEHELLYQFNLENNSFHSFKLKSDIINYEHFVGVINDYLILSDTYYGSLYMYSLNDYHEYIYYSGEMDSFQHIYFGDAFEPDDTLFSFYASNYNLYFIVKEIENDSTKEEHDLNLIYCGYRIVIK